jgi:hypothetical protein
LSLAQSGLPPPFSAKAAPEIDDKIKANASAVQVADLVGMDMTVFLSASRTLRMILGPEPLLFR